ncbi:MAG: IS30 family transposase [Verrucomicrobiota bacterium]
MLKRTYRRLREEDRHIIYRMRKAGNSQIEIAHALGFSQSAISKELSRNRGGRGYRPKQANEKAQERQDSKRVRSRVITGDVKEQVCERLGRKHSPEQISGALRRISGHGPSRTSIYNYIEADKRSGGDLHLNLRINGKRRYRHRNKASRHKLANRVGIEERPAIVERRGRYGDWEADLIAGCRQGGYVLSLYERKSRAGKLVKLSSKDAEETAEAIITALEGLRVYTLTYDNGLEFAGHEKVSRSLDGKSYFCQPYHSWEKGGVENFNGLVRQYFPKGTNFLNVSEASLADIEAELNERPRKSLKFQSPDNLKHKLAA